MNSHFLLDSNTEQAPLTQPESKQNLTITNIECALKTHLELLQQSFLQFFMHSNYASAYHQQASTLMIEIKKQQDQLVNAILTDPAGAFIKSEHSDYVIQSVFTYIQADKVVRLAHNLTRKQIDLVLPFLKPGLLVFPQPNLHIDLLTLLAQHMPEHSILGFGKANRIENIKKITPFLRKGVIVYLDSTFDLTEIIEIAKIMPEGTTLALSPNVGVPFATDVIKDLPINIDFHLSNWNTKNALALSKLMNAKLRKALNENNMSKQNSPSSPQTNVNVGESKREKRGNNEVEPESPTVISLESIHKRQKTAKTMTPIMGTNNIPEIPKLLTYDFASASGITLTPVTDEITLSSETPLTSTSDDSMIFDEPSYSMNISSDQHIAELLSHPETLTLNSTEYKNQPVNITPSNHVIQEPNHSTSSINIHHSVTFRQSNQASLLTNQAINTALSTIEDQGTQLTL